MKNDNKGFSLIELIVVIAIMAILVGALAPQLLKYIDKARVSADTQALGAVYTAVQTAYADPEVGQSADIPKTSLSDISSGAASNKFYGEIMSTLGGNVPKMTSKGTKTATIYVTVTDGLVTVECGNITIDATGSTVS